MLEQELELETTPLRSAPRSGPWAVDALGAAEFEAWHCAGCGREAELEWRFTPLDADRRYLEGCYRVCRPCMRRVLLELEELLPDLGPRPLRGYA